MKVQVDFIGEIYSVDIDEPLVIGRDGQLAIDDNPFLHRRFLEISLHNSMVWLTNVGSQLSATVSDEAGLVQAWLSPGARLPLVFARTTVWFTAGPTTYDFDVLIDESFYVPTTDAADQVGETTIGRMTFTPDQKLLIVVLSENVLRRGSRGAGTIPSSADAAKRLGWTITKFNRKLDNVCQKLSRSGIRGLHGDSGRLATSRRARLVEYAMAARLVSVADLTLLEQDRS